MIKNKYMLSKNEPRKLVLDVIEYVLNACNPRRIILDNVRLEDNILIIKDERIKMNYKSIYVIGGGKASGYMAEALNTILKDKITAGLVIIPDYINEQLDTGKIKLWKASHPIPTAKGVEGVKKMLELAKQADKDDLVICLISGGGSALMPMPYNGITLEEKQELTRLLLNAGANIDELNTVRKHISAIKGGRLVKLLKTNILALIISDVINDRLDTIASGLTVPDNTTYADAKRIIEKYNLWNKVSYNIKRVIEDGIKGDIEETPKPNDPIFKNVKNIILANNEFACIKAMEYFVNNGIDARILTTALQGEAKDVGLVLASIANEIDKNNRPFNKPIALIAGGETYVSVKGNGKGGRNQELVLSALRLLDVKSKWVLASIGTDGIDGNSDAAGAIIDNLTKTYVLEHNINIEDSLKENDSNTFFKNIGDAIYTGATGTNVNDITLIFIYS
ncbi:MAG: glycerate kinase [Candidatus Nitrosocaldaceae archaeon]|nr:MAG: glycerate kinase [Candidatus Nitrosocaldaceae archaeon]